MEPCYSVEPEVLRSIASRVLEEAGVLRDHARIVAECLVFADLRGIDSHGVVRLPTLVRRVKEGSIRANAVPRVIADFPGGVLIDAGGGFGHVAALEATDVCIERARLVGICCAGVRNSSPFGVAGYYAIRAARRGMIGIAMSNAAPAMAPWGGAAPLLGTNPLAIAAPAGKDEPLVLDMATAVVARGKIRLAAEKGKKIPLGWALDRSGKPTDDPREALEGTLLPIGGPKGYGLALMIDVLAGLLTGSGFAGDVGALEDCHAESRAGHFFCVIDPERFLPSEEYRRRMLELVDRVKRVPLAEGVDRVYLPGEIEAEVERERRSNGIPVPTRLWDWLCTYKEKELKEPLA